MMESIEDLIDPDPDCEICEGEGLVCENHPERVWPEYHVDEETGQECGGAGKPCSCTRASQIDQ